MGSDSRRLVRATAFAMAMMPVAAMAQTAEDPQKGPTIYPDDIVVTAQKREQSLIDVPISITAITGADLAKRSASTIEDLQYAIPGISITQFSPGQQRVQMRGVSVYSGLPTVGVYQDEMPLNLENNQSGQDVRLLDINRVEVLRGPQGTLYGQGAVGGTIRYITNDVDLARIGASASGEVAGVNGGATDWKGEAMLNVPMVTDRLGVRFAGSYQNFGGWIDNPILGGRNVNGGHALTLRGKLKMVFTDAFKLTLTVQHQELAIGAQNLSDGNQKVFDRVPTPFSSTATLANATATYDLGFATLLSSTGYIDRRDQTTIDLTNTLAPFIPLFTGVPSSAITGISSQGARRNKIFTEEVRLSSNGDAPLGWTVGGFYRNSQSTSRSDTIVVPDLLPPGFVLFAGNGTSPENSRSWAVFGEGSYRILPTLTALVGLRYFQDQRVQDTVSTVFGASAIDRGRATFDALSPRFNLSWQPNDRMTFYANVAKGFRSGGFNVTSTGAGLGTVPPSFAPDTLWSYEVGGKFRSADHKLSVELSGYRNDWNDVQTTTNIPGLPTNFTTNGGKLAGWGADGSISYTPVSALTFTLTGGWNNMAYKSNSAEHLAGDRADYVPRFTGSASAEYRFDLGRLPSFVRLDYQHSDSFQVFIRNFQTVPARSDVQDILNARVGISGDQWSAAVFVRNVLNRDSVLYPAFAALIYPARMQPRTAGLSFSVKY
jgi:outer membrane receptor protein involved in Fe transport